MSSHVKLPLLCAGSGDLDTDSLPLKHALLRLVTGYTPGRAVSFAAQIKIVKLTNSTRAHHGPPDAVKSPRRE